jgi:hypothetical protein
MRYRLVNASAQFRISSGGDLGIDLRELGIYFQVVLLRGNLLNIEQLHGHFVGIKTKHYGVALDPWRSVLSLKYYRPLHRAAVTTADVPTPRIGIR